MIDKRLSAIVLGLLLAGGPALAQQGGGQTPFTKENIGKAVGAAAGALLGSQIGSGRGKLAAVAIGTLAGYWAGGKVGERLSQRDQAGIAHTTQRALESGETRTWRNPDSGVSTRVSVREADTGGGQRGQTPLGQAPVLELINEYYVANANINVRGGPSTDYAILYRLAKGERVPVVGRVAGSKWLMIAEQGVGNGFLYGPLLSRTDDSGNAIRASLRQGEQFATYEVQSRQCRNITQEVELPDGTSQSHEFKACRQSDGSWMEV